MMLPFLLVFLGTVLPLNQAEETQTLDFDFKIMPSIADWTSAQDICSLSQHILMPELGNSLLRMGIFERFNPEEFLWLNAKNVVIGYGGTKSASLKFSYRPADFRLTSYLCYNERSGDSKRNVSCQPLSWQEAQDVCHSSANFELLKVSTPDQLKGNVYLFQRGITFWVDKMTNLRLPTMVSTGLNMSEECWGVMKQLDGSLTYKKENCSNRHSFVCFSKNSDDQFAPTVTRMSRPQPKREWNTARLTTEFPGVSAAKGSYIAIILVGVILILAVTGVGYYLRSRWWRMKGLRGYVQRIRMRRISLKQPSAEMASNIQLQPHYQPGLQLTLWARGHQMDS